MTSAQTTETEKPWRSLPVFLFQIEKAEAQRATYKWSQSLMPEPGLEIDNTYS